MEGVTLEEPSCSELYSFPETVFSDGLMHVIRAGGIETAVSSQERREDEFVPADKGQGNSFHVVRDAASIPGLQCTHCVFPSRTHFEFLFV